MMGQMINSVLLTLVGLLVVYLILQNMRKRLIILRTRGATVQANIRKVSKTLGAYVVEYDFELNGMRYKNMTKAVIHNLEIPPPEIGQLLSVTYDPLQPKINYDTEALDKMIEKYKMPSVSRIILLAGLIFLVIVVNRVF
ncbi:MAG: hypothetical protein H6908_03080 [Hyphomicrobiales bacterium]|nr:hypothetical protein [Rickettsiales bacterium]MCP5361614.1 hypothetical protein [Hyphomicrobiales bacterium]